MNRNIEDEIIKAAASGGEALVDGVVRYIATRDVEDLAELTVEGIARRFMTSRSHLHYLFRRCKDITPGFLLIGCKMGRAAALLTKNPMIRITEVSQKVGFYTVDYFIRVFYNYFGTTPGKFRMYMRIAKEEEKQRRKALRRKKKKN